MKLTADANLPVTRNAPPNLSQRLAGWLAASFLMARGRRLFERNCQEWNLPLSKFDKLLTGGFIILKDYGNGLFPPTFTDQAKAHQAEIDYYESTPGVSLKENREAHMRKPFWGAAGFEILGGGYVRVQRAFDQLGVKPKQRLLELGCGSGWMAEFLALTGYSVVGTSIAPHEIALANLRAESFRLKGLPSELGFQLSPMETVDEVVEPGSFDAVYAYQALHHAFDWHPAVAAAHRCLKPGGWLVLADEPNVLHTFISYRVARIARIHEIGLSRKELVARLTKCGFREIRILAPRFDNRITPHWIAARK
jgi:SAM-dependent methyltransferase